MGSNFFDDVKEGFEQVPGYFKDGFKDIKDSLVDTFGDGEEKERKAEEARRAEAARQAEAARLAEEERAYQQSLADRKQNLADMLEFVENDWNNFYKIREGGECSGDLSFKHAVYNCAREEGYDKGAYAVADYLKNRYGIDVRCSGSNEELNKIISHIDDMLRWYRDLASEFEH